MKLFRHNTTLIKLFYSILFKTTSAQDNNEVLSQEPIVQTQQPQEVTLRRSTRERRSAILDDYIVFLQEHEVDVNLVEDDPINLQ